MTGMTIGKVAAETGLGIDTIRFYEREGLIPAPARRPSGYRDYGQEVLDRLRFIRRAKDLGFSLREISELLSLKVDQHRSCADVLGFARSKIEKIDERISELQRVKDALVCLSRECTGLGIVHCWMRWSEMTTADPDAEAPVKFSDTEGPREPYTGRPGRGEPPAQVFPKLTSAPNPLPAAALRTQRDVLMR